MENKIIKMFQYEAEGVLITLKQDAKINFNNFSSSIQTFPFSKYILDLNLIFNSYSSIIENMNLNLSLKQEYEYYLYKIIYLIENMQNLTFFNEIDKENKGE